MHEQRLDGSSSPLTQPGGITTSDEVTPGEVTPGEVTPGEVTPDTVTSDGIPSEDVPSGTTEAAADRAHGRRALWISVAGLAAIAAAAIPIVSHFTHSRPEQMRTPVQLAGLSLDTTSSAQDTSDYLRTAVAAGMSLDSSVGAVYTDGQGDAHSVIFVGGTSRTGTADARLTTLFGLMSDGADGIGGITRLDAGTLGGEMKCGVSTDSSKADSGEPGGTMTICGWADDTTVGIALFPNRTVTQASNLLRQMRPGLQGSA